MSFRVEGERAGDRLAAALVDIRALYKCCESAATADFSVLAHDESLSSGDLSTRWYSRLGTSSLVEVHLATEDASHTGITVDVVKNGVTVVATISLGPGVPVDFVLVDPAEPFTADDYLQFDVSSGSAEQTTVQAILSGPGCGSGGLNFGSFDAA